MAVEEEDVLSRINDIDKRVASLEDTRPYLVDMIKRNVESNDKLAETLQDMKVFMQKTNDVLENQSEKIEQMGKSVDGIKKRMDAVEENTKFDIMAYIKKNLPWIIVLLGAGTCWVSSMFKF